MEDYVQCAFKSRVKHPELTTQHTGRALAQEVERVELVTARLPVSIPGSS